MSIVSGAKIRKIWDKFYKSAEEFRESRYRLRHARAREEFLRKTATIIKDRLNELQDEETVDF